MSKAFTRESDDAPDEPIMPRTNSALPPGAKNYLTADGAQRFRDELQQCLDRRGGLLEEANDFDGKRRLRQIDQRIADLEELLSTAQVVEATGCAPDEVCFGSTVTVRERDGTKTEYRIVGVDEVDFDRGWVSWVSPVARALMNARRGEKVAFKFPSGEKELEIVEIR